MLSFIIDNSQTAFVSPNRNYELFPYYTNNVVVLSLKVLCLCYIDIGRCGVSANEITLHPNNNLYELHNILYIR